MAVWSAAGGLVGPLLPRLGCASLKVLALSLVFVIHDMSFGVNPSATT